MVIHGAPPGVVATGRELFGGSDDLGEEHRRQDPIDGGRGSLASEELGYLIKELVVGNHVAAGQLDELCPWNVFCEVATALDGSSGDQWRLLR
jgi:hypothetical protein